MTPMHRRLAAALVVTAVTVACDDVPLLPQWDADFSAPLGSDNITLPVPGTPIPSNTSRSDSSDLRTVAMGGYAGDILWEVLEDSAGLALERQLSRPPRIRLEVRVTKTPNLTVTLTDTVYLAASAASLATSSVGFGYQMSEATTSLVDTLALDAAGENLLRQLVRAKGTLYLRARGRVTTGASGITVQASDSIHVRVGILVRVPIAGGGS